MTKITSWLGDIYKSQGYVAALITLVVLVALALGVSLVAGIDLRDIARWVGAL